LKCLYKKDLIFREPGPSSLTETDDDKGESDAKDNPSPWDGCLDDEISDTDMCWKIFISVATGRHLNPIEANLQQFAEIVTAL
jgi:hypothetical protein